MAAGDPVHHEPPDVQHGGVVVDVQDRDLVVVLAQDEEEGVHELDEFGEVVPPEDTDNLGGRPSVFLWDISPDTFPAAPKPHVCWKKPERPAGPYRPLVKATCRSLRSGFNQRAR